MLFCNKIEQFQLFFSQPPSQTIPEIEIKVEKLTKCGDLKSIGGFKDKHQIKRRCKINVCCLHKNEKSKINQVFQNPTKFTIKFSATDSKKVTFENSYDQQRIFVMDNNCTQKFILCSLPPSFSLGMAKFQFQFDDLLIETDMDVVDGESKEGTAQQYKKHLSQDQKQLLLTRRKEKACQRKQQKHSPPRGSVENSEDEFSHSEKESTSKKRKISEISSTTEKSNEKRHRDSAVERNPKLCRVVIQSLLNHLWLQ